MPFTEGRTDHLSKSTGQITCQQQSHLSATTRTKAPTTAARPGRPLPRGALVTYFSPGTGGKKAGSTAIVWRATAVGHSESPVVKPGSKLRRSMARLVT